MQHARERIEARPRRRQRAGTRLALPRVGLSRLITGGATDTLPVDSISRLLRKPFWKDDLGAAIRSAMPRRAANGR